MKFVCATIIVFCAYSGLAMQDTSELQKYFGDLAKVDLEELDIAIDNLFGEDRAELLEAFESLSGPSSHNHVRLMINDQISWHSSHMEDKNLSIKEQIVQESNLMCHGLTIAAAIKYYEEAHLAK